MTNHMNTGKWMAVILCCGLSLTAAAQGSPDVVAYIAQYRDAAIREMERTSVPAAITLAQGIHESQAGQSDLVQRSNNHFGIKCKSNWTGESVYHDDDKRGECFRKYESAADSYRDHSDFLRDNKRYAFLFDLDPEDYKAWAYGLKKAGYATNPRYPQLLIHLIEDYHLEDYTLVALGKMDRQEVYARNDQFAKPGAETGVEADDDAAVAADPIPRLVQPDYPAGVFMINNARVTFVQKGTSFLLLAKEFDVPLSRIFEFNELQEKETLERDQLIFLQRKRKTGHNDTHKVAAGESLYDIAQAEGMRLESLMAFNYLGKNMQPAPGETLYLKDQAPGKPKLSGEVVFGNPIPKK